MSACGADYSGSIPGIHPFNLTPSSNGRIAFFHNAYTGSIPVGVKPTWRNR